MCHNIPTKRTTSMQFQRGAALPLAIFIIVVMSILGVTMTRILADASRSTVADVLGARAEAAARTGTEILLTQIFPLGSSMNTSVCEDRLSGDPPTEQVFNFATDGLLGCEAQVFCDQLEIPDPYPGYNFRIRSIGTCQGGNQTYSRQLMLEATDENF